MFHRLLFGVPSRSCNVSIEEDVMQKCWRLGESSVYGTSVFATKKLRTHESIGLAFKKKQFMKPTTNPDDCWVRHDLGVYVNHSVFPSCNVYRINDKVFYLASRSIEPGEELTVDYGEMLDTVYDVKLKQSM